MINSAELRIGNWVQYYKDGWRIGRITSLNKKSVTIDNWATIKYNSKYIQHINITEEILLKCGFEEVENKFFQKNGILLGYLTTDEWFQYEWTMDWSSTKWNLMDLKYLHQLQNLIYALTQTELEINL